MQDRIQCWVASTLFALVVSGVARAEGFSHEQFKVGDQCVHVDMRDFDNHRSVRIYLPAKEDGEGIDSGRVDVWLLAKGGQAVPATTRPATGLLRFEKLPSTRHQADYTFSVEQRDDLIGIVVSVDGQLHAYPMPTGPSMRTPDPGLSYHDMNCKSDDANPRAGSEGK